MTDPTRAMTPVRRFGAAQRARLDTLGLVPMVRRGAAVLEDEARKGESRPCDARIAVASRGQPAAPRPPDAAAIVRLRIAGCGARAPEGRDAALVADLLASLGLDPAQVRWEETAAAAGELPLLVFGGAPSRGAHVLAALERLRDPLEKRIAWTLLRRLRRQLRDARA